MLSGDSLPKPVTRSKPTRPSNLFDIKKNYYFCKRTQEEIRRNGSYDLDRYRPLNPGSDRSQEKQNLQDIMEFGKKIQPKSNRKKLTELPRPTFLTRETRINEISQEISDRMTFLEDMRSLGEGKRFEPVMKQEIAAKLLELKHVQEMSDDDFHALGIIAK